jgi:DNA-binding transcriptional LysR family regulator
MHRVDITLEQLRALEALARTGTFTAAAAALGRGHTSVLYLIRTLEDALGFAVVDRSGYRTTLSAHGRRVLAGAREVLAAEAELHAAIHELRAGWEPTLRVVFDGIVPIEPLLRAVGQLARERVPTQIDVRAEFLAGVEDTFVRSAADLMIAVVPPAVALTAVPLAPLPASLVAHRDHPLAHGRHDTKALRRHLLLTVRGSDPRLEAADRGDRGPRHGSPQRLRGQARRGAGRHRLRLAARRADPRRPGPRAGQADRLDPGVAPPLRAAAVPPRPPRPGGPAVDRGDRLRRPGRWRAYTGRACRHHRRPVACACGSGSTCGCPRCTAGWCWRCC